MKRFLLATVSVVALTSVARAADMPAAMPTKERMYAPAPIVDWTGGYFGIQGGGVLHDTKFNEDGFFTASTLPTRIEDRKTGLPAQCSAIIGSKVASFMVSKAIGTGLKSEVGSSRCPSAAFPS